MSVDYREAIRLNLTFSTPNGEINPQDLWSLSIDKLKVLGDTLYNSLEVKPTMSNWLDTLTNDELNQNTNQQQLINLKLDIVKDVLIFKLDERKQRKLAAETKKEVDQLKVILHQKQQDDLRNKSAEELLQLINQKTELLKS